MFIAGPHSGCTPCDAFACKGFQAQCFSTFIEYLARPPRSRMRMSLPCWRYKKRPPPLNEAVALLSWVTRGAPLTRRVPLAESKF